MMMNDKILLCVGRCLLLFEVYENSRYNKENNKNTIGEIKRGGDDVE